MTARTSAGRADSSPSDRPFPPAVPWWKSGRGRYYEKFLPINLRSGEGYVHG